MYKRSLNRIDKLELIPTSCCTIFFSFVFCFKKGDTYIMHSIHCVVRVTGGRTEGKRRARTTPFFVRLGNLFLWFCGLGVMSVPHTVNSKLIYTFLHHGYSRYLRK